MHVTVTANIRAAAPEQVPGLFAPLLDALGAETAQITAAEPYEKFPGTWMITAELVPQPGADSMRGVQDLAGRLGLDRWFDSGDAINAATAWDRRHDPAPGGYPGIEWISIEADPE